MTKVQENDGNLSRNFLLSIRFGFEPSLYLHYVEIFKKQQESRSSENLPVRQNQSENHMNYNFVINLPQKEDFALKTIGEVKTSDATSYLLKDK